MIKAYREEAREHLKNCVGARFSAEALVIALAGGRIGQSDWSFECDRIINLLDDDADYRRGFEDGLKANIRAAFAAAKQAIPERTCRIDGSIYYDGDATHDDFSEYDLTCGHTIRWHDEEPPNYCPCCGARVIERKGRRDV